MCVFVILIFLGPRVATAFWWLFQPARFDLTFSSFIVPLLGIIFIPWTTLMYVIVAPGGLSFWNWLFLGLALVLDIASYGGSGKYCKNKKCGTKKEENPSASVEAKPVVSTENKSNEEEKK